MNLSPLPLQGFEYRLAIARQLLREGRSLNDAARAAEMTKAELDLALWKSLGTGRGAA